MSWIELEEWRSWYRAEVVCEEIDGAFGCSQTITHQPNCAWAAHTVEIQSGGNDSGRFGGEP